MAGHATPDGAVQGYATAARAHGVRIETHASVTAIRRARSRSRGGASGGRAVSTDCVICAAGPWSAEIGAMAGVDLPVTPERRRIAYTGALDGIPEEIPMTVDFSTGFYFHREGPGLLFGTNDVTATQDEWLECAVPVLGDGARRSCSTPRSPAGGGATTRCRPTTTR